MVQGVFATDMRYHQTHCERLRAMIDSAADHQVVMGGDPTAPAAAAALAGPLLASLARYCPPPPPPPPTFPPTARPTVCPLLRGFRVVPSRQYCPAPRHRLPACSTRMLPLP